MNNLIRNIQLSRARQAVENAGLYVAQKKDLDYLADVAADSFNDYPLHVWLSNGKYDYETTKLIIHTSLKALFKNALIYADSKEMNGFAAWMPVGFSGSKALPFLINGGVKIMLRSGFGIIRKLLIYEKFAMNLKKEFTNHRDWYLYDLSVKQGAHGKGIASKLLRPMLQFCDDEGMMAYLETNKENNVSLYEHYGFVLKKEDRIPNSSTAHYAMVRPALPKN